MKKNANKGFSLVELIIVIAIMAVLIGVLAPQFIKQVEKSRESTDLQNVEEIKTAVETFVADYGENLSDNIEISVSTTGISVSNATYTPTGGTAKTLADYGIDTSNLKIKSKKWTAFKWTYNVTNYTWSVDTTTGATYFDVYGNTK